MQKTDPLILTKLHPPHTRPGLVPRPRLLERLVQGLRGPLTLITAPAGFGKTTLAASLIASLDMPVAWLSLDKNDNQSVRFLNYVVAALQQADQNIGKEAAQLMAGMEHAPAEALLTSLINDLDAMDGEIALVLDDYQFINSQAVHEEVAFLLEHCPGRFHLLIATRSDPPLPLARLRACGQMLELRAVDLGFTESEAAQFLNDVMGLALDPDLIAVLEERTEGWIAGLQMAALSMRGRDDVDGFIRAFAGTNRFIMDFMLEEVLAREPLDVQVFLQQTSILGRLSGPLCEALTGNPGAQEMLERLEKRNVFVVSLDEDRQWYRYHHLFADLLQARLLQSGSEPVERLFSRAARWCEQAGQINDAVEYAFAAYNYGHAADLVVQHWQTLINKGEIENIYLWLNALPDELVRENAPLSDTYCWILWLMGQINLIEPHLLDAERAWDKLSVSKEFDRDNAAHAQLPASLAVLRAFVSRYHSEFETAIAHAERALDLLPENLPPEANVQLKTMIYLALGSAYEGAGWLEKSVNAYSETIRLSRLNANVGGVAGITYRLIGVLRLLGRLHAADVACRDALMYIKEHGMARLPSAGILHIAVSEVLIEWNDLETAETHLAQGIELGKWGGRLDAVRNAAYALMRLRLAHQDGNGALAAVQEAQSALGESPSPLAKAELLALKARILVRQDALSDAAACITEALNLAGEDQGQTGEMTALAAVRVHLAQKKAHEAITQLTGALAVAQKSGRVGVVLELYLCRSLAFVQEGRLQEANSDLEQALALAEAEGFVRIFLDEGQPIQNLLAQWLADNPGNPLRDYASRLLTQFEAELKIHSTTQEPPSPLDPRILANQALVESLSERELEVLDLMAEGMTNKEIARQLIVAAGTIKAHAASIYRKLDAANRTEAVARARQLGILP